MNTFEQMAPFHNTVKYSALKTAGQCKLRAIRFQSLALNFEEKNKDKNNGANGFAPVTAMLKTDN